MGSDITLFAGDIRKIMFRLRERGSRTDFDVSGAVSIELMVQEITSESEVALAPIICDPDAPDADWSTGKVVTTIGLPVTTNVTSYTYALVMLTETEEVTLVAGQIDVEPRAGWPEDIIMDIEVGVVPVVHFVFDDFVEDFDAALAAFNNDLDKARTFFNVDSVEIVRTARYVYRSEYVALSVGWCCG